MNSCFSKIELMLYRFGFAIEPELKEQIGEHLKMCRDCRETLKELDEQLDDFRQQNEQAELVIYRLLPQLFSGKIKKKDRQLIEKLVKEFPVFEALLNYFRTSPAPGQVDFIPIPDGLQERLWNTLNRELSKPGIAEQISGKVAEIKQKINRIRFRLQPLELAPVFRGESPEIRLTPIDHPGGALRIETGVAAMPFRLLDIEDREIVSAYTDEQGHYLIPDLAAGEYWLETEGFEVSQ